MTEPTQAIGIALALAWELFMLALVVLVLFVWSAIATTHVWWALAGWVPVRIIYWVQNWRNV